jgi:hypothetical protein
MSHMLIVLAIHTQLQYFIYCYIITRLAVYVQDVNILCCIQFSDDDDDN